MLELICHRLAEAEFQPAWRFLGSFGAVQQFQKHGYPSASFPCVLFFFLPQIHCRLRWSCQIASLSLSVITISLRFSFTPALSQICSGQIRNGL
jgi:hypothetical protein